MEWNHVAALLVGAGGAIILTLELGRRKRQMLEMRIKNIGEFYNVRCHELVRVFSRRGQHWEAKCVALLPQDGTAFYDALKEDA